MPVASPCQAVCVLDPQSRICTGCGRTLDEIAAWSRLTDAEKHRVISMLSGRMAGLAARATPAKAP